MSTATTIAIIAAAGAAGAAAASSVSNTANTAACDAACESVAPHVLGGLGLVLIVVLGFLLWIMLTDRF